MADETKPLKPLILHIEVEGFYADEGCTGEGRGRGHTYTASEVKVLTETATRLGRELGRREAGEQIAVRCEQDTTYDTTARWYFARIARNIASPPSGAVSDATSGVPGHQEVSEAVRSPQEPGEGS